MLVYTSLERKHKSRHRVHYKLSLIRVYSPSPFLIVPRASFTKLFPFVCSVSAFFFFYKKPLRTNPSPLTCMIAPDKWTLTAIVYSLIRPKNWSAGIQVRARNPRRHSHGTWTVEASLLSGRQKWMNGRVIPSKR